MPFEAVKFPGPGPAFWTVDLGAEGAALFGDTGVVFCGPDGGERRAREYAAWLNSREPKADDARRDRPPLA